MGKKAGGIEDRDEMKGIRFYAVSFYSLYGFSLRFLFSFPFSCKREKNGVIGMDGMEICEGIVYANFINLTVTFGMM